MICSINTSHRVLEFTNTILILYAYGELELSIISITPNKYFFNIPKLFIYLYVLKCISKSTSSCQTKKVGFFTLLSTCNNNLATGIQNYPSIGSVSRNHWLTKISNTTSS
jgi:hypothetical protein